MLDDITNLQEDYLRDAVNNAVDFLNEEEQNEGKKNLDEATLVFLKRKWLRLLRSFSQYGKVSHGNKIVIYDEGDKAFKEMIVQIENAKERVWLETYIFDNSLIAQTFVQKLKDAARRGCDVILHVDWVGGFNMRSKWIEELEECGCTVVLFNEVFPSPLSSIYSSNSSSPSTLENDCLDHDKFNSSALCHSSPYFQIPSILQKTYFWLFSYFSSSSSDQISQVHSAQNNISLSSSSPSSSSSAECCAPLVYSSSASSIYSLISSSLLGKARSVGPIFFRNHRKILIVDNQVAFVGSMNISADTAGKEYDGNGHFYDTHLQVQGPAVCDLADVFRSSLVESFSGVVRDPIPRTLPLQDGCLVQVLESNVKKNKRDIQSVVELAVRQASLSINLTTSYFLPPGFLRRALQFSIRKGVCTDILLSGKSDILGDVEASTHVIKKFLRVGDYSPNIYFMLNRHCHAKVLVVDNIFASVGSFNWDRYSSRRNLEVVLTVFDGKIAKQLKNLQQERIKKEKTFQMTIDEWNKISKFNKFVNFLAYSCGRLLGKNIMDGLSNARHKCLLRRALVHTYLEENAANNLAIGMMWGIQ